MKVLVCVVNNPIFIELQYKLLKKFMQIPYEFIVFNDAKEFPDYTNFNNPKLRNEISELCKKLNIKCIEIDNKHHQFINNNASTRHTDSLRIMKSYMNNNPDMYLMLDSDIFPISDIDIKKYSSYKCGAIVEQQRNDKKYMWPNLFYLDTTKVPDWNLINWDIAPGLDTGGMTHSWLYKQQQEYPEEIFYIKHLCSCGWNSDQIPHSIKNDEIIKFLENDTRNINGKYWCEMYDNTFLHYRAGSNWNNEGIDIHKLVTNNLILYLNTVINE